MCHQKCEEKRQQYVKDLAQVEMKVQSFLANPISNERLLPKVIEETEEDAEEPAKELQATFAGVSTMQQMNKKRSEVAFIDFQKQGESSIPSPVKNEQRDSPVDLKNTPRSKVASPRVKVPPAADTGRKGETGRTNASTALPGTGRSKVLAKKAV